MDSSDHSILGVPYNASQAEIRKAYRQLALTYHPDRNPSPDAAEQFRTIQEAYERLSRYSYITPIDTTPEKKVEVDVPHVIRTLFEIYNKYHSRKLHVTFMFSRSNDYSVKRVNRTKISIDIDVVLPLNTRRIRVLAALLAKKIDATEMPTYTIYRP